MVRPNIYVDTGTAVNEDLGWYLKPAVIQICAMCLIHYIQMASGYKYAARVSLFKDNEKILNGFGEGVFIVEQESGQVAFSNQQF